MKITKHIPNFVDTIEKHLPDVVENTEELLSLEWIKNFSEFDFDSVPFWRYSTSEYTGDFLLMAEWKNDKNHKWWVIGYVDERPDLPEFKAS